MKISIVLAALTGSFETDMNRASKTTQKRMKEIEKSAVAAGKVIGAALVAGAGLAAAALKSAIDRADELSKTAQKIGVTTEALSTLAYAAQLADVDIGQLQGGLTRLVKAQGEAADGNKEMIALFDALGVSFKNADGTLRDTGDTFRDVAKALEGIPDGATKTRVALELMGRSGANLIPLTKGLEEAEERARALGLELSTQAGKDAEEFNDQLTDLSLMVTALAQAVASDLLPDIIDLVRGFQESTEAGDGFKSAGGEIADAIRGIGTAASTTFNTIKTLTLGIVGMTTAVLNFLATYTLPGRLATSADQRSALADISAVTLAGAGEARDSVLGGGATATPLPGQGTGRRGGAARQAAADAASAEAAERALAEAMRISAGAADAAAAAKAANAAATRAAAEAAREAAKREKEEMEAAKELAERVYEQQKELRDLAAEEARQRADAKKIVDDMLADIALETKLIGLNNLEREKQIALRYANVDATSKEGLAIAAALDELDKAQQVAEGMDVVRDATRGLFSDLMDGSKSASDAFKDFVDNILDGIAQIVARNLTENLLGSFGSTGGGQSGGFLSSLFGAFFGGARAGGGPVTAGKAFLVGEKGPELFVPPSAGTIATASQTAAMGRSGTREGDTYVFHGPTSKRATDRVRMDRDRSQRRALAEMG